MDRRHASHASPVVRNAFYMRGRLPYSSLAERLLAATGGDWRLASLLANPAYPLGSEYTGVRDTVGVTSLASAAIRFESNTRHPFK